MGQQKQHGKTVIYGDLETEGEVREVQHNKHKKQISFNRPFEALKDLKIEQPAGKPGETKESE